MTLTRTTPADPDYQLLVVALDGDLAITDGEDHAFYNQFNGSDDIQHVIVGRQGDTDTPVACGAIKAYDATTMEVKRMYTADAARGRGLAGRVLTALEEWARELGYPSSF